MIKLLINKEVCKGCGLCQVACPKNLLIISDFINDKGYNPPELIDPVKCTGCALCARMCPDMAIEIREHVA